MMESMGTTVLGDLEPEPSGTMLPKKRFIAFFKTDLNQTLRAHRMSTPWRQGCKKDENNLKKQDDRPSERRPDVSLAELLRPP